MVRITEKEFRKLVKRFGNDKFQFVGDKTTQNVEDAEVVKEICTLHNEIISIFRTSLEKAIRVGELLDLQKEQLTHGDYTPWIENNLPFTVRTAQNYVNLYKNKEILKNENVSCLSSAYKLLSGAGQLLEEDEKEEDKPSTKSKNGSKAPEKSKEEIGEEVAGHMMSDNVRIGTQILVWDKERERIYKLEKGLRDEKNKIAGVEIEEYTATLIENERTIKVFEIKHNKTFWAKTKPPEKCKKQTKPVDIFADEKYRNASE